jgi:hypothetical protein
MVGPCGGGGELAAVCDVNLWSDGAHWICDDLARPLLLPDRPRFPHRSLLLSAPRSDVSSNALSGTVPTQIGRLTGLTLVYVPVPRAD